MSEQIGTGPWAATRLTSNGLLALVMTVTTISIGACSPDSTGGTSAQTSTTTTSANDALTREEGEQLQELLNTTDIAVEVSADVESLSVRQIVRYEVVVTNLGPNPASLVLLVVASDSGMAWSSMDEECARQADQIECSLGEILARATRTVSLQATLESFDPAADPSIETHVEVKNLVGTDPNEANNEVLLELPVDR